MGFEAPQTRIKVFGGIPLLNSHVTGERLTAWCPIAYFRHYSTKNCHELNKLGMTHLMKIAKLCHVHILKYVCVCDWCSKFYSIYLLRVFVNMLHFYVFLYMLCTLYTFAACILAKENTFINASDYLTLS